MFKSFFAPTTALIADRARKAGRKAESCGRKVAEWAKDPENQREVAHTAFLGGVVAVVAVTTEAAIKKLID